MVAPAVSKGQGRIKNGAVKTNVYTKDEKARAVYTTLVKEDIKSTSQNYSQIVQFYTCQDRKTLRSEEVKRVRELEAMNDLLQREIQLHSQDLQNSPLDAPVLLASIEHKKALIARNAGEILKIFIQDDERQRRIQEIEKVIRRLEGEIVEKQNQWENTMDLETRIQASSVLLLNREKINALLLELVELRRS